MQNLGNLDNQYTILGLKRYDMNINYYNARHEQTQINYIIEIPRIQDNDNNNNNFPIVNINILNIIRNINNPYILRYIRNGNGQLVLNGEQPKNVPYIVYENAPKFHLIDYILKGNLSERQAKLIFKKILSGVQAIHNANICLRDIKPENILFDENYNPKIYEFNFSCLNSNHLTELIGTLTYTPPEVLSHKPYNGFKYDIFSLGQLLMALVTGIFGFNEAKKTDRNYKFIIRHECEKYWTNFEKNIQNHLNLSESFKKLFFRMVAYNPNERPLIDIILNDEWIEEINNLNDEQMNALENEVKIELQNREAEIRYNLKMIMMMTLDDNNQNYL